MEKLEKTTIAYSIQDGGDGSVSIRWFLTEELAQKNQEDMDECWGEPCYGTVETFIGSDVYEKAKKNSFSK